MTAARNVVNMACKPLQRPETCRACHVKSQASITSRLSFPCLVVCLPVATPATTLFNRWQMSARKPNSGTIL